MKRMFLATAAFSGAIIAALGFLGCAGHDAGDGAEPVNVGETSAAITNGWEFVIGQWGNDSAPANLGPSTDRTCFISQAHGQLLGTNGGAGSGTPALGEVYVSNGAWYGRTHQGGGNGFNINVRCIPYASNRVFASSDPNQPWSNVRIPTSPNRQCFISGLSSRNGYRDNADYANLWPPGPTSTGQDPNNWQFITRVKTVYDQYGYAIPGGGASAVCVDVPWPRYGGALGQPSPWHFTTETNIECGLTVVQGNFAAAGNGGVSVALDSTGWTIAASAGKTAFTSCAK